MIRVDYSQFDKHFYFFQYVFVFKNNQSDISFAVHRF